MIAPSYDYRVAEVVKVTDGDTYWLRLDVGFRALVLVDVRLNGYDCPESNRGSTFERERARAARELAAGFLDAGILADDLRVVTAHDPDDFGRWLGDVYRTGVDVNSHLGELLLNAELATVWPTRWRERYDPRGFAPPPTAPSTMTGQTPPS